MWPQLRDSVRAFFMDKNYFKASVEKQIGRLRGLLLALALAWGLYSEQLAAAMGDPTMAKKIKLGGVLLAGLAVMLRAGDKTPESVKALAETMGSPAP